MSITPVTHQYKHLGTWLQTGHRHSREIQLRLASAKTAWGQLARSFFTRRSVSLQAKSHVFQSLIVSKVVYNAHTWAGATVKELERWSVALKPQVGTLLRGFLAHSTKFEHPADVMYAYAGVLPLTDQLHANRLRFLARLLKACPTVTWNLLCADASEASWLRQVRGSIEWFCRFYSGRVSVSAQSPMQDWIQHILLDTQWKGKVKKVTRLALAYHQAQAEHLVWQKRIEMQLSSAGATLPTRPTSAPPTRWECDLCQKRFASKRALAMHCAREHGYRKKVRFYAHGTSCQACCQEFHTRKRLTVHLEHQAPCYATVQACWNAMPLAQVDALDDADRVAEAKLRKEGWWAAKAFAPAFRFLGPALPPAEDPACREMLSRQPPPEDETEAPYNQLQGHLVTDGQRSSQTFWWWNTDLPAFVFQSPAGRDLGGGCFAQYGLARETAILHIRSLVLVHFFSGYRREGDLHQVIEQKAQADGSHIFTISVDLCMQRLTGDLATSKALTWWKSRIRAGQVVGAGGGPPCETYTVARMATGGPKPLRSAEHPRGMPGLSVREWQQVLIGDRLLRFLLEVLVLLAIMGYCGFIEHPQFPIWRREGDVTSIWVLDVVRYLKHLQCVTVVSFDQRVCGADSPKPTTLLLVRLPSVRCQLLARGEMGRCNHGRGAHEALIGKRADGSYNTARAKVYPTGLNELLGCAMYHFAASMITSEIEHTLPDVFRSLADEQVFGRDEIQPDFHG